MLARDDTVISLSLGSSSTISSKSKDESSDDDDLVLQLDRKQKSEFNARTQLEFDDSYIQQIKKHRALFRKTVFDMKPSWEGMQIPMLSRIQFDMDIHTETMRSIFMFNEKYLKIAGYINHFIKDNARILRMLLCNEEADHILNNLFGKPKYGAPVLSIIGTALNVEMHNELIKLAENKKVEEYINMLNGRKMSRHCQRIISTCRILYSVLYPYLKMTALDRMEQNHAIRKSFSSYKEERLTVEALYNKINDETRQNEENVKKKELAMVQFKKRTDVYLRGHRERKNEFIKYNESLMTHEREISEYKQAEYMVLATEAQNNYNNLIASHLEIEKVLRGKRYRIESQLVNWLTKYDTSMLAKQEALEDLVESLERERVDYMELQCLYTEQARLYERYADQKNREESVVFDEKLDKFRMNRACKIIQRAWRAYAQRKRLKKQLKKDKKKAKAAAAAARKAKK